MNDAHSRHLEGVKKAKCSEITKKYVWQSEGRVDNAIGGLLKREKDKPSLSRRIPAPQPRDQKYRPWHPDWDRAPTASLLG